MGILFLQRSKIVHTLFQITIYGEGQFFDSEFLTRKISTAKMTIALRNYT